MICVVLFAKIRNFKDNYAELLRFDWLPVEVTITLYLQWTKLGPYIESKSKRKFDFNNSNRVE